MTHSNRSEYNDRRPYGDRSSKQWDDYDDRWEERRKPYSGVLWDSYYRHCGDRHSSTERTSREYSPKRLYNKDSLSRDWSRKSPLRRRMSSPDWGASERKRQRYTDNSEDNHRYRPEPKDETYRQSSDGFSHLNVSKDFKHTLPEEEDFKYRKAPQDFRHRQWQEEFTNRKQRYKYRPLSPYHKDKDRRERTWDCSQKRTRSHDCSSKSCTKSRERNDSSTDHEDPCQNRTGFPLNGSSKQSFEECESEVTNQSPTINEQRSTEGFQRFLNVLNKGVNVAMLTKIVTQTSTGACDRPDDSPVSFLNTAEALTSPVCAIRQQGRHQNNCNWSEHETSQRLASPQPHHRPFSPMAHSLSDEKSLQTSDGAQSYFHSNSRSSSPSVVEKVTLTPDDEHEHKHKQMQDVLQAIGMDLGFEELGQMSHRIQERLYGKKDSDWGRHHRGSKERETRRVSSPRRTSRSSSSRSNLSPFNRDYFLKKDSPSAHKDVTEINQIEVDQAVEFGHNSSNSSLQDSEKCETNSQEIIAALEAFSPNLAYTVSEAHLTPVMPTYSPVTCPLLPYPALSPALPPGLPHIVPRIFLPRLPHFLPYPRIPPLNVFPAALTQTRHLLPQHISNYQSPFFNLPDTNPTQPLITAQKSKTLSRPRCLQVIETKQPG